MADTRKPLAAPCSDPPEACQAALRITPLHNARVACSLKLPPGCASRSRRIGVRIVTTTVIDNHSVRAQVRVSLSVDPERKNRLRSRRDRFGPESLYQDPRHSQVDGSTSVGMCGASRSNRAAASSTTDRVHAIRARYCTDRHNRLLRSVEADCEKARKRQLKG